ncbi:MAG: tol-pal system protein YbgF [Lysobacterales bacterium]|nr:MAG: tol-pal system protein YbgF [Xanthomonadales bacterium]
MSLRLAAALGVLGSLIGLAAGPAHATASNKELEARANEMDARLQAVERSSQTLVLTQQQIEAARAELRSLRGQIEEARHDLDTLRQQQRDLYADLDRRLLLLEHGAAPVAGASGPAVAGSAVPGVTGTPPSEADIRSQDEEIVYGDAFAALKAARYEDAIRGFQLYLTKYPDGPRADNAGYWLGEAQYVQRDYPAALKSFQSVLDRFPDSRKAADAMLKVGFSQYELKAFRNARATLEKVASSYPGTEAARLASERLARMDVERR